MFLILVLLMGGGSRSDIESLIFLRPAAVLFGAYALMTRDFRKIRDLGAPLWLLLAVAGLIALQSVPLPPAIWRNFPHRSDLEAIGSLIGMSEPWRPLAYAPAHAINSLFAVLVPLCAILLYAVQAAELRKRIWSAFILFGVFSGIWGLIQLTGPLHGPFYTYRVTSPGVPVGLFANRNHQAVFLACMVLASGWYFRSLDPSFSSARLLAPATIAGVLLMLPMILLTGSRAGLAAGGLALLAALAFIARSPLVPQRLQVSRTIGVRRSVLLAAIAAALVLSAVLAIVFARALSVDRLLGEDAADNLRFAVLPTLSRMARDFFPFGSGFGSFEFVYRIYEPDSLLGPRYLNEAHDDWLQLIIEGGLPGLVIAVAFAAWLARAFIGTIRERAGLARDRHLMAFGVMALLLLASFVDYPLRTPMLSTLFVLAAVEVRLRESRSAVSRGAVRGRMNRFTEPVIADRAPLLIPER